MDQELSSQSADGSVPAGYMSGRLSGGEPNRPHSEGFTSLQCFSSFWSFDRRASPWSGSVRSHRSFSRRIKSANTFAFGSIWSGASNPPR